MVADNPDTRAAGGRSIEVAAGFRSTLGASLAHPLDINFPRGYQRLKPIFNLRGAPFRLASQAGSFYLVGCLACERPPAVIWAGRSDPESRRARA